MPGDDPGRQPLGRDHPRRDERSGVDRKTAAEFSFFLAVPTLTGATALQLYKHGTTIGAGHGRLDRARQPRVVRRRGGRGEGLRRRSSPRYGFAPFAWYRIVAGAVALVWLAAR